MTQATTIVTLALNTSGVLGVGQTPQSQDIQDSFTVLNNMITQWNQARVVAVIPGVLSVFPDLTTDVAFWDGDENVLVWNLSARLRPVFGMAEDEQLTKLAETSAAVLQANNKQQQAVVTATQNDNTAYGLVLLSLRAAGRINDQQSVSLTSQDVNDSILILIEMLDEWQQDRNVTVTPGTLPSFPTATTVVFMAAGVKSAIVWNLAVRLRSAFGLEESKFQTERAAQSFAAIQANNKQQQAASSIAGNDNTGYGLIFLALRAAGRINDEQSVATNSQDVSDAASLMQEMLDEWTLERTVTVTPSVLPQIGLLSTGVALPVGYKNAIVLNLACRIREAFGIDENKGQAERAVKALALVQANNKQQIAPLHPGVPATPMQIIFLALRMAGRINDGQSVSDASADVDNAFSLLVTMLGQWNRERWLVFNEVDVFVQSTGAYSYTIGVGGDFLLPSRPERISSAFVRLLQGGQSVVSGDFSNVDFNGDFLGGNNALPFGGGTTFADYPLEVLDSREDYNQITIKGLSSFPSCVFLDTGYPLGTVYLWPVAQANAFEIHLAVKGTLPTFATVNDPLALPPEYNDALIYNLACRLMVLTGASPSQSLAGLARATLQTIRKANLQIPGLDMPAGLPGGRSRGGYAGATSAVYPASNDPALLSSSGDFLTAG